MPVNHGEGPQQTTEVPQQVLDAMTALQASPYLQHCAQLQPYVAGRVVSEAKAGSSGFALTLDDASWVVCALDDGEWRWRRGEGPITAQALALLASPDYGDASRPLPQDVPYAWEYCDLAAEVSNCVGQTITGLAFGEKAFDLCFPGGMELDVTIVRDHDGKLAYRVFWEQW